MKAWCQLKPSPELVVDILIAIAWQAQSEDWLRDRGQWIPYPASWLRAGRWLDEPEVHEPEQRVSKAGIRLDCPHQPKCLARWQCGQKQLQERKAG